MRPIRHLLLRGLLAVALPGMVSGAPAENVLHIAYLQDVSTFDPDNSFLLYGLDAMRVIYQGLVEYRPGTTDLTGWLAESWDVSADGLTYSFRLRPGIRFHDGRPMHAADVLAYFRRRRHPGLTLAYFLDDVAAMEAPDERTFVIRLAVPQPAFLDRLASAWGPKVIGPEALVDHLGKDQAQSWLNEHEDGTGPYRLRVVSRGQAYELVRFPDYWGPPPFFDRIEIEVIPQMAQQLLRLKQGTLDLIQHGYPFEGLRQLPPTLRMLAYDDLGLELCFVNRTRRLGDPTLLRAVLTAINPAGWLGDAYFGYAVPATSLYPRAMIAAPPQWVFPSDVRAARAMVAAQPPVTLEIGYPDEDAAGQQIPAELIAAQLESLGIHANVRVYPIDLAGVFVNDLKEAPDLWISHNYPDAAHPATQAEIFFAGNAPLNYLGYRNPSVDEAIASAALITTRAERDERYLAIARRLMADGAILPLAEVKNVIVYRAGLSGFNPRPALPEVVDFETLRRDAPAR